VVCLQSLTLPILRLLALPTPTMDLRIGLGMIPCFTRRLAVSMLVADRDLDRASWLRSANHLVFMLFT
jgi:hypothetical protein